MLRLSSGGRLLDGHKAGPCLEDLPMSFDAPTDKPAPEQNPELEDLIWLQETRERRLAEAERDC
ncbi:hypothetical protein [Streptomyces violaceoruber]|uniref:hypothetical protein n=1 Tax=Streptomyces violaceoruber TaxID=1935 RepID=UPI003B43AA3B